jgi:uncharacterized protein YycO
MPIRIQLVTEQWNPISMAIRAATNHWASHAEYIDTEARTTLGARFRGGVKIRPCSIDRYSRIEQFHAYGIDEAYRWALTQVGKPYDTGAIAGMVVNRDWHDEGKWFCSEFLAVGQEKAGYPLLSTRPSNAFNFIAPSHLLMSRGLFYLKP